VTRGKLGFVFLYTRLVTSLPTQHFHTGGGGSALAVVDTAGGGTHTVKNVSYITPNVFFSLSLLLTEINDGGVGGNSPLPT